MPNPPTFTPEYRYDYLRDFSAGQHNGLDPLLLPRNQASFLRNATTRGGFLTERPAFRKKTLDFQGNSDVQTAFQTGLWQGAAFYQDDYGNASFVASVSGRLFQLSFNIINFIVQEITIQGDPNPADAAQVWMWQAEKWLIINDGQSNPIFFDGHTCRRARQGEDLLGTTTIINSIPALNSSVTLDLSADFAGTPNMLVRIRDTTGADLGFFQSLTATTSFNGYQVVLTNNSQDPVTVPDQSTVVVPPTPGSTNVVGVLTQKKTLGPFNTVSIPLQAPVPTNISDGGSNQVDFFDASGSIRFGGGYTFLWQEATGVSFANIIFNSSTQLVVSAGWSIRTRFGVNVAPTPAYPVGTTNGTVTFAGGETKTVQLNSPYTGPDNTPVTINGQSFSLSKATAPVVSHQVTLLNLTGAPGANNIPVGSTVVAVPELPPGRMGAYILGRNWEVLTDGQSFIASDIVNGVSGTPAFQKRDAVLHITENNLLALGGSFRVPSSGEEIRAIIATPVLDVSLGQGPILLFTKTTGFSCNASPDRTTWQNTVNPILTVALIGNGAEGQNSTVTDNSDILFRSLDGIRSYILSRINFDKWGQTPQSYEVSPTLNNDDEGLLPFASAMIFDNRFLMTANPNQIGQGIYHDKIVVLNFDLVSSLRGKSPAAYDGIWDGLNVLQLITGTFGSKERGFAFCFSSDFSAIELWEIHRDGEFTTDEGDTPIVWELQSAGLNFHKDPERKDWIRLLDGELSIDKLNSSISFATYYKPDAVYPVWVPWQASTVLFDTNADPQFRPAIGLGEPNDKVFDKVNNRPLREFTAMQFRIVITGHAELKLTRLKACTIPTVDFAPTAG